MTSKFAARLKDHRQNRLHVLPLRLALDGSRRSGACSTHCIQQLKCKQRGQPYCTYCLQDFPFVTQELTAGCSCCLQKVPLAAMNCIKQSGLPSQTDPAFCSGMRVTMHCKLTCKVKVPIADQAGHDEPADTLFSDPLGARDHQEEPVLRQPCVWQSCQGHSWKDALHDAHMQGWTLAAYGDMHGPHHRQVMLASIRSSAHIS